MKKINTNKGAVTLIFVMVMALIITLLLAATQSRLLLALRRNQSSLDVLIANYKAESIANDAMAKLVGGYIETADIPESTFTDENTEITIEGQDLGTTQIVTVTAKRDFAVGKVQAVREIQSLKKVNEVEIILSLDCTGSMDAGANCDHCFSSPTRFDSQESAAIDFIDNITELEDADKFKLGVSVFGIDAKWLTYGGQNVTPESGLSFNQIKEAIDDGFNSTRSSSPACTGLMDSTSIGSAYSFSHDYFSEPEDDVKHIEVVITDGVPNSRIPASGCSPSVFCPAFPLSPDGSTNYCEENEYSWECYNYDAYKDGPYEEENFNEAAYNTCQPLGEDFLRCSVADTETYVPEIGQNGVRDPAIDAYAVTIFSNPPRDVVNIFRNFATENGYFNASRASQLKNILNTVLNEILKERSTVTLRRVIP